MVQDVIMEGDEAKRVMRGFEVSRMAPRNRADEEEDDDDGEEGGSSALRFLVEVAEVEGLLTSIRCCEYLSLSFFMRISLAVRLRDNRRLIGGVAFSFFSFVNVVVVVVVVEAGTLFDDADDVTLRSVWNGFRGGVSNRSISSFSSWLSSTLSSKKMFVEDREGKRCIGVNRCRLLCELLVVIVVVVIDLFFSACAFRFDIEVKSFEELVSLEARKRALSNGIRVQLTTNSERYLGSSWDRSASSSGLRRKSALVT